MGWLFSETWPTRAVLREHLVNGNGVKTLKSCWKGNNLWAVQEVTKQDGSVIRFVALYLCAYHGKDLDGWGYKDIDESMGPCRTNCPVSYIEMVEAHEREHDYEPAGYAKEWRERVRAYHARGKIELTKGQKIKLYGNEYTVAGPRRGGTYFIYSSDGMLYNLPRRQFRHVVAL